MTNTGNLGTIEAANPVLTVAPLKEDTEMLRATDKITALYCRLSVEDMKEDKKGGKDHCGMTGMKMPVKYVCEMFIDRISASKNYQREKYTDRSPIEYYLKSVDHYMIHEDTKELIEYMLYMLAEKGEKYTFSYVKNEVLKGKVPYDSTSLKKLKDELHVRR